ncbi:hypothetical protein [Kribbella sp. NPDC051620]|uniref:hypothetical protein n=1 Tax=Kribbella sp. NPDC051620 TaxID=3364120 RepID=UPI0037AD6A38
MKMIRGDNPLAQWRLANKPDRQTDLGISRWLEAAVAPADAVWIETEFEKWLADRSRTVPDLVECVGRYGYTRLLIQGWTKVPIDIEPADFDRWRAANYLPTIEDFHDQLAGVAGGFLELAGQAPVLTSDIIRRQIDEKLSRLDSILLLPLSDFTPREMSDAELEDGDDSAEQDRFDRPFVVRQQLECFEWAMERIRMLAVSEHNEELGLPNHSLYEALMTIDLNALLVRLRRSDDGLRRILQHLAKFQYYQLDSDIAPESFWWRHWKSSRPKR